MNENLDWEATQAEIEQEIREREEDLSRFSSWLRQNCPQSATKFEQAWSRPLSRALVESIVAPLRSWGDPNLVQIALDAIYKVRDLVELRGQLGRRSRWSSAAAC
jgi:hypothetical protein